MTPRIVRRVGSSPAQRGSLGNNDCPDIFELADGNYAVIGREATAEITPHLPPDAGVGPDEAIVVIPPALLADAARDLLADHLRHLRGALLGAWEAAVHDRRVLLARLQDAGIAPPEPKEHVRMLLAAALRAAGATVTDRADAEAAR